MTLSSLPEAVTIYEVGPRDGLQNEPALIAADAKIHFINLLSLSGLPVVEVSSFVRPELIPQLADAEDVTAGFERRDCTKFTALVPNLQGMARAVHARLDGIAVFTAASETFSMKNTNATIAQTLERFRPVVAEARDHKLSVRGYVSTAFGCPYEGAVDPEAVVRITQQLIELGVDEIAISDTIGVATPRQVQQVLEALTRHVNVDRLALHFHDTRGTALANVLAGLQMGVRTFDASAGGLGGCPYAPGATGNLATEDLVYMLDGLGIHTGVGLGGVVEASRYLRSVTGHDPASRYFHAVSG